MTINPEQKELKKIIQKVRDKLHRERKREFCREMATAVHAVDPKYKLEAEKISQEWDEFGAESDNQISNIELQIAELQAKIKAIRDLRSTKNGEMRARRDEVWSRLNAAEKAAKFSVLVRYPDFSDMRAEYSVAIWGGTDFAKAAIANEVAQLGIAQPNWNKDQAASDDDKASDSAPEPGA